MKLTLPKARTSVFLTASLAGYAFQKNWLDNTCTPDLAGVLPSCIHSYWRLGLGAILCGILFLLIQLTLESLFFRNIEKTQKEKVRHHIATALSLIGLCVVNLLIKDMRVFTCVGFLTLVFLMILTRKELYATLQRDGRSSWAGILALSAYLLFVAEVIFHILVKGKPGVLLAPVYIFPNWALIYFLCSALFFLCGRLLYAGLLSYLLTTTLWIASGIKVHFIGLPLYPWDLSNVGDGILTWREIWQPRISFALIFAVIGFLPFYGACRAVFKKEHPRLTQRLINLGIGVILALFAFRDIEGISCEIFPDYLLVSKSFMSKGTLHSLVLAEKLAEKTQGPDYSKLQITELKEISSESLKNPSVDADVIFYMFESFVDPTEFGIRFKNDPIPFIHSLQKTHSSGHLVVPVFGGGTANTDFEVLTGFSVPLLKPGVIANYQIRGKTPSLGWLLKARNYSTHALNGWIKRGFNWDHTYPMLGVDEFLTLPEDLPEGPTLYGLPTDAGIVDWILDIQNKSKNPVFITAEINSTHGTYDRISYNPRFEVLNKELSKRSKDQLTRYAEALNQMDHHFERLIRTLANGSRKVLLAGYGDHFPSMEYYDELPYFQSDRFKKTHQTPLLIWSNFDIPKEKLTISSNFLSLKVLEYLKIKNWGHFKYFQPVAQVFPVVSHFVQARENDLTFQLQQCDPGKVGAEYCGLLEQYKFIQADQFYGKRLIDGLSLDKASSTL